MRKILAMLMVLVTASPVAAVSLNEMENQRAQYDQAAAESKERADWLTGKINSISEIKRVLDEEAAVAVADYNKKKAALDETVSRIEANELKLIETGHKYEQWRNRLEQRVRDVYINGQLSYLDVMFGAQDFGDFLTRMDLLKHVLVNDSAIVTAAVEYKAELEEINAQLEEDRRAQEDLTRWAEKAKQAKLKKVEAQQTLLDRMEHDRNFYNQRYDEMTAASREVEKLIQDTKYKQAAEQAAREQAAAERAAQAERDKIAREQRAIQERYLREQREAQQREARELQAAQQREARELQAAQQREARELQAAQQREAREQREAQQLAAREQRAAQQQADRERRAAQQQELREQREAQQRQLREQRAEQQRSALEQREADRQRRAADRERERLAHSNMYVRPEPEDDYEFPEGSGEMLWPLTGPITSEFGWRTHPVFGGSKFHSGLDIGGEYGAPIKAARGGVVTHSGWIDGYGNTVMIDHGDGLVTLYGHNQSLAVSVGQTVRQGQTIAYCGSTGNSTGPHCHFEVRLNGEAVSPYDYL